MPLHIRVKETTILNHPKGFIRVLHILQAIMFVKCLLDIKLLFQFQIQQVPRDIPVQRIDYIILVVKSHKSVQSHFHARLCVKNGKLCFCDKTICVKYDFDSTLNQYQLQEQLQHVHRSACQTLYTRVKIKSYIFKNLCTRKYLLHLILIYDIKIKLSACYAKNFFNIFVTSPEWSSRRNNEE